MGGSSPQVEPEAARAAIALGRDIEMARQVVFNKDGVQ